jgi:hypothetical protein
VPAQPTHLAHDGWLNQPHHIGVAGAQQTQLYLLTHPLLRDIHLLRAAIPNRDERYLTICSVGAYCPYDSEKLNA